MVGRRGNGTNGRGYVISVITGGYYRDTYTFSVQHCTRVGRGVGGNGHGNSFRGFGRLFLLFSCFFRFVGSMGSSSLGVSVPETLTLSDLLPTYTPTDA